MLNGQHFYYQTIRRSVVAFGNLFKDLVLVKYANDVSRNEISRQTVPLVYGGKEDFWVRIAAQPELPAAADLNLPTISFSLIGVEYDSERKLQSLLQNYLKSEVNNHGVSTQYVGVPYRLKFSLSIFVRNIEDGTQIVEQIMPWFTPDYTQTIDAVDAMNLTQNIPLTLNSVSWENKYEGAAKETMRAVIWTLDFTVLVNFYGPISTGGIIRTVTANILNYESGVGLTPSNVQLNLTDDGLLTYTTGETVYQGVTLPEATATGTVVNYTSNTLIVTNVQGAFAANSNVKGAISAASWNVVSVPVTTNLVSIVVTPIPSDANIGDDYGFLTQITETPNIFG